MFIPAVSLEAVTTLQAGTGQIHKKQSDPNRNTHSAEEKHLHSALRNQKHWKEDALRGDLRVEMGMCSLQIVFSHL